MSPVYSGTVSSPDPGAVKLCEALHLLPDQRLAECCGGAGGSAARRTLADQCTRVLSLALRGGKVTLDAGRTAACLEAQSAALQGCGWVGPAQTPLPAACQGLAVGTLERGARCRSALECRDGLRCRGLGPTEAGVCDAPGAPGTACDLAADPLAVYLLQDAPEHAECSGVCVRRTCVSAVATGEACTFATQCGAAAHCAGGRCVPGRFAREGEACIVGACEQGAICRDGRCLRRKLEGQSCREDSECLGGCRPGGPGDAGTCGARCP